MNMKDNRWLVSISLALSLIAGAASFALARAQPTTASSDPASILPPSRTAISPQDAATAGLVLQETPTPAKKTRSGTHR